MSARSDSPEGEDAVRLRAVFVPDGQTPPAALLEGMVDIVRLTIRPTNGPAGTTRPDESVSPSG